MRSRWIIWDMTTWSLMANVVIFMAAERESRCRKINVNSLAIGRHHASTLAVRQTRRLPRFSTRFDGKEGWCKREQLKFGPRACPTQINFYESSAQWSSHESFMYLNVLPRAAKNVKACNVWPSPRLLRVDRNFVWRNVDNRTENIPRIWRVRDNFAFHRKWLSWLIFFGNFSSRRREGNKFGRTFAGHFFERNEENLVNERCKYVAFGWMRWTNKCDDDSCELFESGDSFHRLALHTKIMLAWRIPVLARLTNILLFIYLSCDGE